jgi:hypothetical protein
MSFAKGTPLATKSNLRKRFNYEHQGRVLYFRQWKCDAEDTDELFMNSLSLNLFCTSAKGEPCFLSSAKG